MKKINGKNKMGYDVDTETYEKNRKQLAVIDRLIWILVVVACGYLAYSTGRAAKDAWGLWILVIAFVVMVIGGVNEIIRKDSK